MISIHNKIIGYFFTGIINTIVGYAIYAVLLFIKVPYKVALLLATIAGVIFNYFSFGRIVFRNCSGGKVVFVKFISAYIFVYIANVALLKLLIDNFHVTPYLGQVICLPLSVFLSWLLLNYWVYKNDGFEYET